MSPRPLKRLRCGGGGNPSALPANLADPGSTASTTLGARSASHASGVSRRGSKSTRPRDSRAISGLGGWATFDAGRPAAAKTYFVTALRAPHQTRDSVAEANTIESFSLLLLESGRPGDAQHLAGAGRRAAARGPLRVQAMVATREARATAARGGVDVARARLGEAAALFDRALNLGEASRR